MTKIGKIIALYKWTNHWPERTVLVILFPCSTPIDLSVRILRNFNTDRRDRRNTH